mmetsp:Transcript_5071/g.20701  ORF Transcript_5071/g.20701 Transcript_5071/m.20701 type:complete len:375 (-) Transcript_5071:33-1157(-)
MHPTPRPAPRGEERAAGPNGNLRVARRGSGGDARGEGREAAHRPRLAGMSATVHSHERLRQEHQSAALAVDDAAARRERGDGHSKAPVAGELMGVRLGVPAAEQYPPAPLRQRVPRDGRERYQIRAALAKQRQILAVVVAKRGVAGDAHANRVGKQRPRDEMRRARAHAAAQPRNDPAHEVATEGMLLLRGVGAQRGPRVRPGRRALGRLGYHRELVAVLPAEAVQPVQWLLRFGRIPVRAAAAAAAAARSLGVVQAQPPLAEGSLPQDSLPLPSRHRSPVSAPRLRNRPVRTGTMGPPGVVRPRVRSPVVRAVLLLGILLRLGELPRGVHHGREVHRLAHDVRELRRHPGDKVGIARILLGRLRLPPLAVVAP